MLTAQCPCGALTAQCEGAPVRISVCHCLDCQRRSGSAFAAQARFAETNVRIDGPAREYRRTGDSGVATFSFCPDCGATIAYRTESMTGLVAIPIGAFADPAFPPPAFSNYEERKQPWVEIVGEAIAHHH
jgi:hypothetical protein